MKIRWQAEDGYIGSRPHMLEISDDEFEGMTEDEIESYVDEAVRSAFEEKVYPSWIIVTPPAQRPADESDAL